MAPMYFVANNIHMYAHAEDISTLVKRRAAKKLQSTRQSLCWYPFSTAIPREEEKKRKQKMEKETGESHGMLFAYRTGVFSFFFLFRSSC